VAHTKAQGIRRLAIERLAVSPLADPARPPVCQAAARAAARASERSPIPLLHGGSDPDYLFTRVLGIPRVNIPYAAPRRENHAPNENITLEGFFCGIKTSAAFLHEAAKL